MPKLKVKIGVYKNVLVIDADPKPTDFFVPAGGSKIGCVLMHTDKHLGISKEALEWLKKVPKSHDDIGDVDCFESVEGWCFSWLGGVKSAKKLKGLTGSRTYSPEKLPHVTIENEVPDEAKKVIDGW